LEKENQAYHDLQWEEELDLHIVALPRERTIFVRGVQPHYLPIICEEILELQLI
jgi:hypothetical protein